MSINSSATDQLLNKTPDRGIRQFSVKKLLKKSSRSKKPPNGSSSMLETHRPSTSPQTTPIPMDYITTTRGESNLEAIKPSMFAQIWAIYTHFLLLKRRYYGRLFMELIVPVLACSSLLYALTNPSVMEFLKKTILQHNPSKYSAWTYSYYFLAIPLFFHFYYSINWLVLEKHEGFLLLMHTMGLKKSTYYLGVSSGILTISLPISLLLGGLFKAALSGIQEPPPAMFPLFFIVYPVQLTSIIFAFGSLFNSPSLAAIVILAPFLELLNSYIFNFTCNHIGSEYSFIPMILAHISPLRALLQMLQHADPKIIDSSTTCQGYNYPYPSVTLLLMMFWSIVMYSFAWYFDSICPWQTSKSPESLLFCFSKKIGRLWHPDETATSKIADPFDGYNKKYFEKAPQGKQLGIYIDNVTKSFVRSTSGTVVDSLSLSVYSGQTTLLLGHNGAGKTTLMNMIIGNLSPSQGRLYINGYDIGTFSEDARMGVGLCPQESILMAQLTVEEHLDLFAKIKSNYHGRTKQQHINSVLKSVGLSEHRKKLVIELSGGMKRKLSLGLAFVGDSNVLILDEPSSGVDPESRKFIWDSIRMYRSSRTVLLSTQHMEEADYLGDRIAIMNSGKIVCCGSSVFLKKAFGSAYRLRLECQKESLAFALSKVRHHFPMAKFDSNDQGPTNHNLLYVDTTIELLSNDSKPDDQLIQLFEDLEKNHRSFGIKSFGLKCSTIEDVLLNSAKVFGEFPTQSNENIALELQTISNRIALVAIQSNHHPSFSRILLAYIVRHFIDSYRNIWTTLLIKLITPVFVIYSMAKNLSRAAFCDESGTFAGPDISLGLILLMIIIAFFIRVPLVERTSKFKLMQLCSKATYLHYWLSRLVSDLAVTILYPLMLMAFLQYLLTQEQKDGFGGGSELLAFLFLWMILLSAASLLLAYILTTCIADFSNALALFLFLLNINRIIKFTLTASQVLQLISYVDFNPDAYLYYVIPTVTAEQIMVGGFFKSTFYENCPNGLSSSHHLYNWSSSVWLGIIFMALQSVAYAGILMILETKRVDILSFLNIKSHFIEKRPSGMDIQDEDVMNEEIRARSIIEDYSGVASNALIAKGLTKSYASKQRAVDGLTFAVGKSECFGLLGPNGAGKSTTFSMMTGDIRADYGRLVCNKLSPEDGIEVYCESIGYDPQSNSELRLTPVEALYFMARLRGVEEDSIKSIVDASLDLLNMQEHRGKSVSKLSGGTKRKLSLAMALIGSPPVLMLDEPTAGIDPMSRRDIWLLLSTLKSKYSSSIIISSHAMEECEAICDRLSIMIQGRMRCLGSFQHLRSKFGQGYIIRVQYDANVVLSDEHINKDQIDKMSEYLNKNLRNSLVTDDISTNSVVFKVTDGQIPRSVILKLLKSITSDQPNLSYLVSDSTLEDIFVSLAKEQKEPKSHSRSFND